MPNYEIQAYKGYFIAAYGRENTPGEWLGIADISVVRPGAGMPPPLERVQSVGLYGDETRAVAAAQHKAREIVDGLGPNWDPFTAPGGLPSM